MASSLSSSVVYYKYSFEKGCSGSSVPIEGHYVTVYDLKEKIVERDRLQQGKDFDLVFQNAKTHQEYADEDELILRFTSLIVRRVPRPSFRIVVERKENEAKGVVEQSCGSHCVSDSPITKLPEEKEWNQLDFGHLFAIPEELSVQSSKVQPGNQVQDVLPENAADENSKIKTLIQQDFGLYQGYRRDLSGKMHGLCTILERKKPPPGYICNRCKDPGHFIQHCPTNGDSEYDIKRLKYPQPQWKTLEPDETAFEKAIDGIPSTKRLTHDIPLDLRCPICKEVMQDAVIASKCCFKSFCDKCIRNHLISKGLACVCGATNVLADDLLPNKTLRDTVDRFMSSSSHSEETSRSKSRSPAQPVENKVSSPILSATSKGDHNSNAPQMSSKRVSSPVADEKVKLNSSPSEPEKKKRKVCLPNIAVEHYMMPYAPSPNDLYWGSMQLGLHGYLIPYTAGAMPYMAYTPSHFDFPGSSCGHNQQSPL